MVASSQTRVRGIRALFLVGVLALSCGGNEASSSDDASPNGPSGSAGVLGGPAGASATANVGGAANAGGATPLVGGAANAGGATNPSKGGASSSNGGASSSSGGTASSNGGASSSSGGTAGTSGRVLVGVYCGNDPASVVEFEAWLGHPVDGILGYTGAADWADYDGSVGWAVGLWSSIDRTVFWSVPLIPKGATLEEAARGTYDTHYRQAAQKLAAYRPQEREVHIRTGWEFNGNWFPWSARGKEQSFVGAFRHFVDTFRSVSSRFVFEWNVNIGNNTQDAMNPESAYPGDDYVDLIGMDFYWNTTWDPADPQQAWQSMLNRNYGLKWHQAFAASHSKRTSYSEWGVMSNQAGPYIEQAKLWFQTHGVVFHTYWNSDSDFRGKLSSNQYPTAGAAYRAAFAGN